MYEFFGVLNFIVVEELKGFGYDGNNLNSSGINLSIAVLALLQLCILYR